MANTKISDTIKAALEQFMEALFGRLEAKTDAMQYRPYTPSGMKKAPKYVEGSEGGNGKDGGEPNILDIMKEKAAIKTAEQPFQRELLGSTGVSDVATQQKLQRAANFQKSLETSREARRLGDRGAKEAGLPLAPKNYGRSSYVDAMGVETPANEDTPQEKKYKAFKVLLEAEGNRRLSEQSSPWRFDVNADAKRRSIQEKLGDPNLSESDRRYLENLLRNGPPALQGM